MLLLKTSTWCVYLPVKSIQFEAQHDAQNYNNDSYCRIFKDILENIYFNNGDDNIAIKAGRDNDGREIKYTHQRIL
jgi:polygalacturonase